MQALDDCDIFEFLGFFGLSEKCPAAIQTFRMKTPLIFSVNNLEDNFSGKYYVDVSKSKFEPVIFEVFNCVHLLRIILLHW